MEYYFTTLIMCAITLGNVSFLMFMIKQYIKLFRQHKIRFVKKHIAKQTKLKEIITIIMITMIIILVRTQ